MNQTDNNNYDDDEHFDPTIIRTKNSIFQMQQRALIALRHSEASDALVAKHPKIFRDVGGDPMKTCMAWGIDCGVGWFDIIDCLCEELQNYCNRHNLVYNSENNEYINIAEDDPRYIQVVALQVKEKYGTLRFYASGSDDVTSAMIRLAEEMSARICETCGSSTKMSKMADRIIPICAKCDAAHEANHNNEQFRSGDMKQ